MVLLKWKIPLRGLVRFIIIKKWRENEDTDF